MHELIDHPGIALEVANQLLVVPALLQRGEAELLIKLGRFRHFTDVERVGSHFVNGHLSSPPIQRSPSVSLERKAGVAATSYAAREHPWRPTRRTSPRASRHRTPGG